MTTQKWITPEQKQQLKQVGVDVLDRGCECIPMSREDAQNFLSRGDQFQAYVLEGMRKFSGNRFASQETASPCVYGYDHRILPLGEQIEALARGLSLSMDGVIGYLEKIDKKKIAKGAEGRFAIPSPWALARKLRVHMFDEFYGAALVYWLEQQGSKVKNFPLISYGQFGVTERTLEAYKRINREQRGEIWIIEAQLGLRHKGRSADRAAEKYTVFEFGLGSLEMLSILYTHPGRFGDFEKNLHLFCEGDRIRNGVMTANGERFDIGSLMPGANGTLQFMCRARPINQWNFGVPSGFVSSSLEA